MNYQYTCHKCAYTASFSSYDLAGKTLKSCIYCGHHTPIMQDLKSLPPMPQPPVSISTSDYQNISVSYNLAPVPQKTKYYCCTACKYVNPIHLGSDGFQYCYKCNTEQYVSDSLSEFMRGDCKSCKGMSYFCFTNYETLVCVHCKWVCYISDLTVDKNPAFYTSKGYCNKCSQHLSYFYLHTDNGTGNWSCSGCMVKKLASKNTYVAPGYKNYVKLENHYYAADGTCIAKYEDFLPKVQYTCNACLAIADHDYSNSGSDYVTYTCMICHGPKTFYKDQDYIPSSVKMDITWTAKQKVKIPKVEEKKEKTPVEKKPDSGSIIAYIRDIERLYHYLNDDKFICGYTLPSSKKNNVERLSKKDQETVLKHLSSYMCVECINVKNEAKAI